MDPNAMSKDDTKWPEFRGDALRLRLFSNQLKVVN